MRSLSHQLYRELSSCMHDCSHPHPRSTQQRDHHNGGVSTRTEGPCTAFMKGKGGLERRCFTFDLVEGRFVEGRGGWRTVPWDQWKSWAITCHTCEKDLQVCEKVLKAAVKVAVRVKYPTLLPTVTHLRKIQMLWERTREWSALIHPNGKQLHAINFSRRVSFSCFNHRWQV